MSDKIVAELMALYRHTIAAYGGASIAELAKREAEFEQAIRRAVDWESVGTVAVSKYGFISATIDATRVAAGTPLYARSTKP